MPIPYLKINETLYVIVNHKVIYSYLKYGIILELLEMNFIHKCPLSNTSINIDVGLS